MSALLAADVSDGLERAPKRFERAEDAGGSDLGGKRCHRGRRIKGATRVGHRSPLPAVKARECLSRARTVAAIQARTVTRGAVDELAARRLAPAATSDNRRFPRGQSSSNYLTAAPVSASAAGVVFRFLDGAVEANLDLPRRVFTNLL
jgi:hypothetical protein